MWGNPDHMIGKTITHYRIIEEVGRGGMGTVYAAEDTKLGRKVALKVLSSDVACDDERVQRFMREAQAASAINHPNIATIYEIDEADGTTFIAMEFVEGGTLRDRMDAGPMPFPLIIELTSQITKALGNAHELGIVHRDIKPENIAVRPDGLVKILDFGLAKLLPAASEVDSTQAPALTAEGVVMGTARYMSPEQARGKPVDAAADVFSVGAILYEMATGRPAFPGDNHFEILYAVVNTAPAPIPDELGFPREFLELVARALAKSATDRYPDCRAVAEDLSKLSGGVSGTAVVAGAPGAAPTGAATLDTVWTSATGVIGQEPARPGAAEPLTSIAVLPFKNMSGNPEADWMSSGLQMMLSSDLARVPTLRVVPADRLAALMTDLKLGPDSAFDEVALRSVGEFLSVDTVVGGTFVKLGPASRIDVSIRRPSTGEDANVKAEAADEAELLKVIAHLAAEVRRSVETEGGRDLVVTMVGERGSGNPDAIRAYVDGLSRLHEGNNLEAIGLLQEATSKDADFVLAYTYLGEALANAGRTEEARESLKKALDRSGSLSRSDSLFVTAREAMMAGEVRRAIEAFELLTQLLPNNLGAFYELAQAYELEGEWDDAIKNLERVIKLDPKFVGALFALGRVHIKRGSCQDALDFLYRALSLNTLLGNEEGRATVLNAIGIANFWLDKYDESLKFYEDSLTIKRGIGDRRGESATLSNMATVYQVRGDYERSVATYEEALRISEDLGDEQGTAESLINIGTVYEEQGALEQALESYKRALKVESDLGDKMAEILCLNDIGNIYLKQGKLDDAEVYFGRALDARRQLGERKGIAITLNYLGNIERLRGRYDRATGRYLEALKISREIAWRSGEAETRVYMAAVMAAQSRYQAALESASEGHRIFEELEDKNGMATALSVQSKSECALGRCEDASGTADAALALAREIGNEDLIADALLIKGTVTLMGGHTEEAVNTLAEGRRLGEKSGARVTELEVASALGLALWRAGRADEARSILSETAKAARTLGLGALVAITELREGEVLLASGETGVASDDLADAVARAASMGAREVVLRGECLLAEVCRVAGDADAAAGHALSCLEAARSLSAELGGAGNSFLSRPLILSAVETAAGILANAGRDDDLARFTDLRVGSRDGTPEAPSA
jgi:tetratricopeptide (TPR) repeat protein/predicted Ser/Thr protein kinase